MIEHILAESGGKDEKLSWQIAQLIIVENLMLVGEDYLKSLSNSDIFAILCNDRGTSVTTQPHTEPTSSPSHFRILEHSCFGCAPHLLLTQAGPFLLNNPCLEPCLVMYDDTRASSARRILLLGLSHVRRSQWQPSCVLLSDQIFLEYWLRLARRYDCARTLRLMIA